MSATVATPIRIPFQPSTLLSACGKPCGQDATGTSTSKNFSLPVTG